MSVTFGAYTIDEFTHGFNWMETDLNVSNSHFFSIMNLLGYENPDYCGSMNDGSLQDFHDKILFSLNSLKSMPSLDGGTPTVEAVERRVIIVECGLRAGYYTEKLEMLSTIVSIAIETNATLVWS